jgi:flagellar biosynthesis/type III secretory pathway M-ring protein FliF/YscJ
LIIDKNKSVAIIIIGNQLSFINWKGAGQMNTFWLKIAALVIVVVAVIVLIGVFSSSEKPRPAAESANKQEDKPKTFYDQVDKDREKFSSPPKSPEQLAEKPAEKPVKQQVQEQNQPSAVQTPPPVKLPVAAKPSAQPV